MKAKIIQLCALFFLLFQFNLQAQNAVPYSSIADAFVVKGLPTTNYGTDVNLNIKGSTNATNNRKSYLKFDITGGISSAEQIVLKVVKYGGEELQFTTQSSSSKWEESTINWDNAPEGLKVVEEGYLREGNDIYVDLTSYIKSKIASNQFTVSLLLSSDEIIGSPFKVYSKESDAALQPKIIFYKTKEINFPVVVPPSKEITLSKYISSDMVIQRGKAFPFIGEGEPGETLTVDFVRENVHYKAFGVVSAEGNFLISIPAMEATTFPCTATISVTDKPEKTVMLTNILVGDVWFAGGQSNMEKKIDYILEANAIIADADNFKNIRAYRAEYNSIFEPTDVVKPANASWIICDRENVSKASAVAYVFAKKIYQETGIPIGIMQAYVGGTMIETWISPDKIRYDKKLKFLEDRIPEYDLNDSKFYQKYPSVNYNGMVNPLRFFPIKGFLYYQGESNVKNATEYATLMKALIQDYRAKWNMGNLPFYFVQLANMGVTDSRNYEVTPDDETWQMLRQQQLMVYKNSRLENIGMAVIIETNEEHLNADPNIRIHPHNKMPVGNRLAKIALKEQYNKEIIAYSPQVEKTWIEGNKVFIQMKNVGTGLKIRTNVPELMGFALANEAGTYFDATATIEDTNLISIESNSVAKPAYIAYGWSRDPYCTLDNSADLPASPFKMALNAKKELKIIEDSFIQYGGKSSINSGSSTNLKVGQIDGIENQSFLKIDLKDLDFTRIENAKLRLTASTADFATLSAHITTADWKESEINGINAPQLDEQIGTISINKGATTYTLDITTAIKEVIANDNDFLSIALKSENGSVSFFSKENATDQPVLILNEEETNLGTDQFAQSEEFFLVYPNPVKNNILKIHSKNLSENLTKISMVSLSGQSFPFPSFSGREEQQLDLSRLSSGTYFLVIESSDNQKFNKKIIVP